MVSKSKKKEEQRQKQVLRYAQHDKFGMIMICGVYAGDMQIPMEWKTKGSGACGEAIPTQSSPAACS
jgi:hypothetical protein